ncbi:MAG: transglutaminase-like domain-containing protein [Myxococcota bacterium]
MNSAISDRFQTLATLPERPTGLAEGALVVAAEARDGVDIAASLRRVDELVARARPIVEQAANPARAGIQLNHWLFEIEGYRGNQDQYDDLRNSFLDQVLVRRRGLPITLSILYVEVARRVGLEAYGVGFPGHFLAKVVTSGESMPEVIVDPFFGRVLTVDDCLDRLRAATGEDVPFDPEWVRPATAREIWVRMLNNLKLLYLRQGDGLAALGCFDRILLLDPTAAHELRDRGLLLERIDCLHAAVDDLTRYLELAPRSEDAPAIRMRRDAIVRRRPALN